MDPNDKKEIATMITEALKPVTESVAKVTELVGKAPTTEALTKTVTEALAPKLTELEGKVTAAAAAKPGENKPGETKPNAGDVPEWAKPLLEANTRLAEQVAKLNGDAATEVEGRRVKQLVAGTLTDMKLTGLLKNPAVLARIEGGKPKTGEEVKKLVDAEREYAKGLGVKVETFGADPEAEGAKPGADGKPAGKFDEPAEVQRIKDLPRGGI